MNEYIAELTNLFSFGELANRSWREIAFILSPTVVLIILLLGYSFFLKTKPWKWTIYTVCAVLVVAYLPYELLRQSAEMSKARANIDEMHGNLQKTINAANIEYINRLNNPEAASTLLDEIINHLGSHEKKELIMISWLMAENERQALVHMDDKQQSLADEIKTTVSTAKNEIINSRTPVEKISGDVVKKLESDVNHLLEAKMNAFKQEIDKTLDSFENDINSFIRAELDNYEEKLADITQQNVDALKDYSSKARNAIAYQFRKINEESIKRLDDTKVRIDGIGEAIGDTNLQAVADQITQISNAVQTTQKKNDILFEYNECIRSIGMLDLGGRKEECKEKLDKALQAL